MARVFGAPLGLANHAQVVEHGRLHPGRPHAAKLPHGALEEGGRSVQVTVYLGDAAVGVLRTREEERVVDGVDAGERARQITDGVVERSVLGGIAAWNGSAWQPIGAGFDDPLDHGMQIVADGDGFVVAGSFQAVDGQPIQGVARWDGSSFQPYGDGLSSSFGFGFVVSSIQPYGDGLFATGSFDLAGADPVSYVAWWDGSEWHPLGAGLADLGERLTVVDGTLWVGGSFVEAGGHVSSGIAAWKFKP